MTSRAQPLREEHLLPLERSLSCALDQIMEAVAVLDAADGSIVHSNMAFSKTFGPSTPGAAKQIFTELMLLDGEFQSLRMALEQARSGQAWMGHAFLKTSAGHGVRVEVALSPVSQDEGAAKSLVVRLRQITPEVEKDRHLRLAQKLSALGAVAGGVAHDFNNLIGAILAAADCIEAQVKPDDPILGMLKIIQQVGGRAKDLTAQILNFHRRAEGKRTLIDLTGLVTEVADLLRATSPGNIVVRSDVDQGIQVFGDVSQLHQVITNLGINANQAMQPKGGVLSIQLQRVSADPGTADPSLPESSVRLTIEDTGCGMDPHTLERIFEPFFTTKEAGQGTGLGLSVVYDIIQGHGGTLHVSSKPGMGSCFHIYLPVHQDRRKGLPAGALKALDNGLDSSRFSQSTAAPGFVPAEKPWMCAR